MEFLLRKSLLQLGHSDSISETVEAPEREFFQRLATEPPVRPIRPIMGLFLAIFIDLATGVVGLFLLTLLLG